MHRRRCLFLLCVIAISFTAEEALARRGRGGGGGSYTNDGSLDIAPYTDQKSVDYPALKVYFNYNNANRQRDAFADKIRVYLAVTDREVLKHREALTAEVRITELSNSGTYSIRYLPVSLNREPDGEFTYGSFDLTNDQEDPPLIEPTKVYRLFVNLHLKSKKYGRETVLGRIPAPYYVATSGDTTLDRARQQIAMRTFKEFYYRKQGWQSSESYSMDCYAYYMWATGFCTVGAENGRTQLDRLFGGNAPYNSGGQIPQLSAKASIHGDYVRKPGHSFMLLSYDPKRQQVWTMEGNFNSTVEIAIRSVSSDWTVGHLRDEHIRRGLFPRLRGKSG